LLVYLVCCILGAVRLGFLVSDTIGTWMSLLSLCAGSFFFLYSLNYYLATLAMLSSSLVLGNGNGTANGGRNASGHAHPHGLMRFLRRGNRNGHRNGNGNGHVDLGYEPFVSIHIATYNERRVIARLLECCAALEYKHYEVVVVDDSTDETTEILKAWQDRPRFKIVHRPNREGFKGGALQVALQHTDPKAEFVIVWDADVVPFADSIQTYLPHFFRGNGNGSGNGVNGKRKAKARAELRPEVAAVQSDQWTGRNKREGVTTVAVHAEYARMYMV